MMPLVVKLGGSTAGHEEMREWIDVLVTAGLPLVIVPGGGAFAEQVRISQRSLHFSDAAAHDMAILAMDQFGIVIAECHPRLSVAASIEDFRQAWNAGKVPVWLPSSMTRGAEEIPRSWDVTSDSLAAWLCEQIGAERLLLIKQVDPDHRDLDELVKSGVVDPMLPRMLGEKTLLHIAGPSILRGLRRRFPMTGVAGQHILRQALEGVCRS